jgi:hypothetical protein
MDNEKIKSEVMQAETNLLTALREGELLKGVSMHLNSPDYRNIWNGEIKTYDMLEARIKMGIEKGLKSIDYKVYCPTRSGTKWQEINIQFRLAL